MTKYILLLALLISGCGQTAQPVPYLETAEVERPHIPALLIIGDSISLGYTPYVQDGLRSWAIVEHSHNPNLFDEGTDNADGAYNVGIYWIQRWIKQRHYDVIHFNFGLHDLNCGLVVKTASLDLYKANLEYIVSVLKTTQAALIFATTTPVPPDDPCLNNHTVDVYNAAAVEIMTRNHIQIDDLNAIMRPVDAIYRLSAHNHHFIAAGYMLLADQVIKSVSEPLEAKNGPEGHRRVKL